MSDLFSHPTHPTAAPRRGGTELIYLPGPHPTPTDDLDDGDDL